jgi:type II secretory pathway component PulF
MKKDLLLNSGILLSGEMEKFKHIFSPFEIELIKAGEASGTLDIRLKSLAEHMEKTYNLQMKITGKLIYPFIILNAGLVVPPVISSVTKGFGYYISQVLQNFIIFYSAVFLIYIAYKMLNSPKLQFISGTIVMITPLVNTITRYFTLSQYLYSFSELYDAGIDLRRTSELSMQTCSNYVIRRNLDKISSLIKQGKGIYDSFSKANIFEPLVLGLVHTGEKSGNMGEMLKRSAQHLETEGEFKLNNLITLLPVILMIMLGIYVAITLLSFYNNYIKGIFNIDLIKP